VLGEEGYIPVEVSWDEPRDIARFSVELTNERIRPRSRNILIKEEVLVVSPVHLKESEARGYVGLVGDESKSSLLRGLIALSFRRSYFWTIRDSTSDNLIPGINWGEVCPRACFTDVGSERTA